MIKLLKDFPDGRMWTAVLTLAFFGGLRGAEYMGSNESDAPTVGQVQLASSPNKVMHYTVTRTKTTMHGYTIPLGCSTTNVCPYCDMIRYMNARSVNGSFGVTDWLFVYSNGVRVTKQHLNALLKRLAKCLKLNPDNYTTHSIRAGAATTAAQCGFSDWEIQRLGGWKSETYKQYIRNLDGYVSSFSARLAGGGK